MNLSLVSQKPSSVAVSGLLRALQESVDVEPYFNRIVVTSPGQWKPTRDEAAILLLDDEAGWPAPADVRDPRYYFVSNGIVMDGHEWEDPASSQLLVDKLASYFPLLSRLSLLRQRSPLGSLN